LARSGLHDWSEESGTSNFGRIGVTKPGGNVRNLLRALIVACVVPVMAWGCATSTTVREAPVTEGRMQNFGAPYDVVKAAALEAVQRLNVNVQGSDETPERFQIRFSKSVSLFSWGEVGVVNVVRGDNQASRVYVNTEKRSQVQVTGTTESEFAAEIFANIGQSVARLQP